MIFYLTILFDIFDALMYNKDIVIFLKHKIVFMPRCAERGGHKAWIMLRLSNRARRTILVII